MSTSPQDSAERPRFRQVAVICKRTVFALAASILAFIFLESLQSRACERLKLLTVSDKRIGGESQLFIPPPAVLDATISMELVLDNMTASVPPPYLFDLSKYTDRSQPFELLRLRPLNPYAHWNFSYHSHYVLGNMGGRPDDTIYSLPYNEGETHRVSQGYFGTFSHQRGTESEYALDFSMPLGTTVRAARSGLVVATRADSNEGGADKSFRDCGNYVVVRHADGTYGEYFHLKQNGALVKMGDTVETGQAIGLSGQTGHARGPHLHFAVFTRTDDKTRTTYPVRFRTPGGVVNQLEEGSSY